MKSRINNQNCNSQQIDQFSKYEGESESVLLDSCNESFSMLKESMSDPQSRKLSDEASQACSWFIRKFFEKLLTSKDNYQPLHDAVKARYDDLDNLRASINNNGRDVEFYAVPKGADSAIETQHIKYVGKGLQLISITENQAGENEVFEIYTISQQPKWMGPLFRVTLKVMGYIHIARMEEDTSLEEDLQSIALMIQSWAGIYNSLRSNKRMACEQEKKLLVQLQNQDKPLSDEFKQLFSEVVADIKQGKASFAYEFSRALNDKKFQEFLNSPYGEADYYFSGKATSYRHKDGVDENYRISAISSCDETDPFKGCDFDTLTGYKSGYNENVLSGREHQDIVTSTIRQNKIKRRTIHIACNAIQDRCSYIHRRLASFLKLLPNDCTFNQKKGINSVIRWTNSNYREQVNYPSISCMDFSNATDLLSQEFQNMCLGIIFPKEIVEFWGDISSLTKVFRLSNGQKVSYKQLRGQPQGILASFCAFALAHHVLMLMTMKQSQRTNSKSSDFCAVLGDDSAINSIKADPDNLVRASYVSLCEDAGLEINQSKSHLTNFEDRVANAEFAKVKVLDGAVNTPVPFRLLSRLSKRKSFYHRIATIIWMASNGYPKIVSQVPIQVREQYSENSSYEHVLSLLQSGIIPGFDELIDPSYEKVAIDPEIAFCYLLNKVKGSILSGMLRDHELEVSFDTPEGLKEQPLFLLKDDQIDKYLESVGSDHKIWSLIGRNLLIEDSIKSILGVNGITTNKIINGLIELDEAEIELFIELDDQLKNLKLGIGLTDTSTTYFRKLIKTTERLDRFSTRSFIKRRVHDLRFIEEAVLLHQTLFPKQIQDSDSNPELLQNCN